MERAIKRVFLKSMPLDKWSGNKYIHATGCIVKSEDGNWHTEYEDNIFEDADNCVYYEDEDEERG